MKTISEKTFVHKKIVVINLPASKSISNRLLIIQSLCEKKFKINNLSNAEDTKYLETALKLKSGIINAGEGGTTLRFLLAFLSCREGEWKLTGSEKLLNRPVQILVDALKKLRCELSFKNSFWFIKGKKIEGGKLTIDGSTSSQFISALLLVAPTFENGLQLTVNKKINSRPYIEMTIELMREFGIKVSMAGNKISVASGKYQPKNYTVESDWSAASYFYELVALNKNMKLFLRGLSKNSMQGDSILVELYKVFGVETLFLHEGILISNKISRLKKQLRNDISVLRFDIKDWSDLFPALVVTCAAKGLHASFNNISNLNFKESERANVFEEMLKQLNCKVKQTKNKFTLNGEKFKVPEKGFRVNTQHDHRVAMSMAPLVSLNKAISFDDKNVVNKSFPDFWKEMKRTIE